MGYVNQAIKKIKSQVPEKKQEEDDEPKDTIVWNDYLKRYEINGVIPEDEDHANAKETKQKKAPPPPPRPVKRNSDIKPPEQTQESKHVNHFEPISQG